LIAAKHTKNDLARIAAIKDRHKKRTSKSKDKKHKKSKSKNKKHKKDKKDKKDKKYETDKSSSSDSDSGSDIGDIDEEQFITQKIDYIALENVEELQIGGGFDIPVDKYDVTTEDWYIENLVFVQSHFRKYLQLKRFRAMMQGVVVRFFMKQEDCIAMITVRKCTANITKTKHSTHRRGGDS
jgi:hypothetical protein